MQIVFQINIESIGRQTKTRQINESSIYYDGFEKKYDWLACQDKCIFPVTEPS